MYFEAPNQYNGSGPSVFLAGGITGCPDWQAEAASALMYEAVVLNPRRKTWPDVLDDRYANEQIEWEFKHLERAGAVLFWFPACESVQPIALYELGFHAGRGKPMAVGVEPGYLRIKDVYKQLSLVRPSIVVHDNLFDACDDALGILRRLSYSE